MTCYDKALFYLAAREHARSELLLKLKGKGYADEEIEATLARLIHEGSLSDQRYCDSYIRSRMKRTPEGRQVLMMRLQLKGVERDVARDAISRYWEEHEDDIASSLSALYESLVAKKGEEKALAFLYRKGFTRSELERARERDES